MSFETIRRNVGMKPAWLSARRRNPRARKQTLFFWWTVMFTLLALTSTGLAQTTLQTPAIEQPPCAGRDCSDESKFPRLKPAGHEPVPSSKTESAATAELTSSAMTKEISAPSEFEQFVAASVGRRLPLYGHNLFDHVPSTFAPVDRVPVTGDYVIGPGDEILVRAWGQIDLSAKLMVERDGAIFLPRVGTLSVAGLKYEQLPDYLRTAVGRVFRNFDLTVSLGQLRSIQVFVVGQARRPGSYTVSSLCTLVNALFASGGPSESGSMRRIQLKRDDQVIVEFDFYDLLLAGNKSKDARLLPGDVIYIPPTGPSIAMAGSVNAPGIYELRGNASLAAAIEMAGGLTATADGRKAVVERIDRHEVRTVEEFPLNASGLERTLQDGDVVRIFSLSPRFQNAVTLRGNVAHPGRMAWHSGMRLRDVIPNPEALITRDYWSAANSSGNLADQPGTFPATPRAWTSDPAEEQEDDSADRPLKVASQPRKAATATTAATTAEMRNQVARDAPEVNWDYAVIQRLNPEDLTTRLVPFDLGKLVLEHDEANNLSLQPGDIITVFSENDLAVPLAKRSKYIRLEGEFRAAGVYRAEPGETLAHLVERAGGFTPNAYLYGAQFTRESARIERQKGLDELIQQLEQDITREALAPSSVSAEEAADQRTRLEVRQQTVAKLRGIKATGRVVLDLKPDSRSAADLPRLALEDGDRFVVPYRPATVQLLGAVCNQNSFLYRREARVEDYLKRGGGTTRDADASRMFIVRADGSVLSRQTVRGLWDGGFAGLRLMPGDSIVVPSRISHRSVLRGLRDWSQVFSQFALGVAAVKVIQ
jgi:polysaccharide biosynthesis/export protein